jgi:hypothetical protein
MITNITTTKSLAWERDETGRGENLPAYFSNNMMLDKNRRFVPFEFVIVRHGAHKWLLLRWDPDGAIERVRGHEVSLCVVGDGVYFRTLVAAKEHAQQLCVKKPLENWFDTDAGRAELKENVTNINAIFGILAEAGRPIVCRCKNCGRFTKIGMHICDSCVEKG